MEDSQSDLEVTNDESGEKDEDPQITEDSNNHNTAESEVSIVRKLVGYMVFLYLYTPSLPVKCLRFSVTVHYNLIWADRLYQ